MNRTRRPREIAVIQFYFYPDMSAASQMLHDLLLGLSREGAYNFTVFCSDNYPRENGVAPTSLNDRLHVKRIRTFHFGKKTIVNRLLEYSFFYLYVFFRFLFSRPWDCVVSLTSPPLIAFALVAALLFKRTPFVYYIQDLYPEILFDLEYVKRPFLIRKLQLLNRIIFRRADKVIVIGEYMAKKLSAHYRLRKNALVEIPNWAEDINFVRPEPKTGIRLLYSGNMGLAHDFSLLPRVIRVLKDDPRVTYAFSGGGKRKAALIAMFDEEGERRVTFGGYIKREWLTALLGSADLLLIAQSAATVGDILPSKIYAALAAGRPVIFLGPRKSETAALLIKNDLGCVLESAADVEKLPAYLDFLFSDGAVFPQVCARARSLFENGFHLAHSLGRFSRALRALLPAADETG